MESEVFLRAQQIAETNRQLSRTNAELAQANEDLEAFSYSVSHDLRTPLRSIEGFSQALLEDWANVLDEKGRDYLSRVRAAARRMATLIDGLLTLSRVGRAEIQHATVDLSELAHAVAGDLQRTSSARTVDFVIADGLVARGDARLLRLVLENLFGNAWKFTGSVTPAAVEFGCRRTDGHATYFVRDNGVGFDSAYADRLFAPFQRLHSDAEFPGTGIGLATVQRIVRRHGGRIWAEGAVGRGATVFWTLAGAPQESTS
jgi:light-regulated signal transduction histidine kinase (bacteriophytochrome)